MKEIDRKALLSLEASSARTGIFQMNLRERLERMLQDDAHGVVARSRALLATHFERSASPLYFAKDCDTGRASLASRASPTACCTTGSSCTTYGRAISRPRA